MADIQEKKNTRQFRDEMPSTWRDSFLIKKFFFVAHLLCVGSQIRPWNSVVHKTTAFLALWGFLDGGEM